jgi:hypothetical protein
MERSRHELKGGVQEIRQIDMKDFEIMNKQPTIEKNLRVIFFGGFSSINYE